MEGLIVSKGSQRADVPIGLLATAGFLSSAGARVVDALLDPIAHDFSTDISSVAIILAAFTVPYGLCQLVFGPVADRLGQPRVLRAALFGYCAATLGCAIAPDLHWLTLARTLCGAASAGLIPVCLAYLGGITAYDTRQVTLSRFLLGVVLAQMLAGPLAGLIGEYLSWRGVFLLLSACALALAIQLSRRLRRIGLVLPPGTSPRSYRLLLTGRRACILLLTILDGAVFTGTTPFIAPYLHERFGLAYTEAGLTLALFGAGALLYVRNAGWLVRQLGERGLVAAGGLAGAAGMALAATATGWPILLAAESLLGLGYFMLHSTLQTRATEMLPGARSTATAGFAFALFTGQAIGALLCAAGITIGGYHSIFAAAGAGIAVLTVLTLPLLRP